MDNGSHHQHGPALADVSAAAAAAAAVLVAQEDPYHAYHRHTHIPSHNNSPGHTLHHLAGHALAKEDEQVREQEQVEQQEEVQGSSSVQDAAAAVAAMAAAAAADEEAEAFRVQGMVPPGIAASEFLQNITAAAAAAAPHEHRRAQHEQEHRPHEQHSLDAVAAYHTSRLDPNSNSRNGIGSTNGTSNTDTSNTANTSSLIPGLLESPQVDAQTAEVARDQQQHAPAETLAEGVVAAAAAAVAAAAADAATRTVSAGASRAASVAPATRATSIDTTPTTPTPAAVTATHTAHPSPSQTNSNAADRDAIVKLLRNSVAWRLPDLSATEAPVTYRKRTLYSLDSLINGGGAGRTVVTTVPVVETAGTEEDPGHGHAYKSRAAAAAAESGPASKRARRYAKLKYAIDDDS